MLRTNIKKTLVYSCLPLLLIANFIDTNINIDTSKINYIFNKIITFEAAIEEKVLSLSENPLDYLSSQSSSTSNNTVSPKNIEQLLPALKAPIKASTNTLVWPTAGKIIVPFGKPTAIHSPWKFSGILIAAPKNQDIYAIAPGKIIYTGFLKGYGTLLIIDHENGYISIYGRINDLYKKINDPVTIGEKIASVGHGDEDNISSLYFDVRYKSNPIDPVAWYKKNSLRSNLKSK